MNKNLFVGAIALLFVCSNVHAQRAIVLTKSNMPLLPGNAHYTTADVKTLSPPKSGKNITWDYSNLKGETAYTQIFVSKIHTYFTMSKTALVDTGLQEALTSNINFNKYEFYDEDADGFYFIGDFIDSKRYNTSNYFNDSADNIIIPLQNDSVRVNMISFPDSFGASHHYNALKTMSFLWTVQSANLDSAPSTKETNYIVSDTVSGWGTLRIPAPANKSIAYPVLLVKRKTVTVVNYFVRNKAPNPVFLKAFGITQGKRTVDCNEYFYTTGRLQPLMVIGFGNDSTFTTPASVMYSSDSIKPAPIVSAINSEKSVQQDFALFPNPTNSGYVNCSFTKSENKIWKMMVVNTMGQVVQSRNIEGTGNMNLTLDMSRQSRGLYFVSLFDANGQTVVSSKLDLLK